MANQPTNPLLRFIRHLAETQRCDTLSDQELLQCYATQRDEAAFTALVRRYGPRLLRICRRVLRNHHDAEDVSQAVFLVLARQAGARNWQASVGCWLYKVAFRLAWQAREAAARQKANESRAFVRQPKDPATELCLRDAEAAFDEELARLPDRLRLPVMLCHLEGQTRDQAAQQLGWSVRTLKRRLDRALKILRSRLDRRGIALSTALLTIGLAEGATAAEMPVVWIGATARAAVQFMECRGIEGVEVVSKATALAQGVLQTMFMAKVKLVSLLLTALLVVGAGSMAAHHQLFQQAGESPPQAKKAKQTIEQPSQPERRAQPARVDLYGDSLPSGAVARLGTVRFRYHGYRSGTMTFTPDGKALLLGVQGPPLLWDAISGKVLRRFGDPLRDRFYGGARLSPDGRFVAARVFDKTKPPGGITVWDTATGKMVRRFDDQRPDLDNDRSRWVGLCCAFSPDSKSLLAQCGNNNLVLWEIATGRQLWTQPDPDFYKKLIFSPDGKTIASSRHWDKGGVQLWDARTGQPLQILGHPWNVTNITFSADSGALFVGYSTAVWSVYLWDIATGQELKRLEDKKFIPPFIFSPDRKIMAVRDSSTTCSLRLWDVTAGKEIRRCENSFGTSVGMAFSPDGKIIAGLTGSTIRFWEVATGKSVDPPRWRGHNRMVTSAVFTEDGKTLISSGDDSTVRFWDIPTSQERLVFSPEDTSRPSAGFAVMGAASIVDGTRVATTAVSSDGTRVAAARVDDGYSYSDFRTSIRIWDTKAGRELRRLKARKGSHCAPVFSPDDKLLAATCYEAIAGAPVTRLWEVATGKQLDREFPGRYPRFSPDGTMLLTQDFHQDSNKSPYHLWDVATGKKWTSIAPAAVDEKGEGMLFLNGAIFSPDGKTLAIAVRSPAAAAKLGFPVPAISLYPVYRSKQWGVRLGPPRIITSPKIASFQTLTFSPDGKMLAAAGGPYWELWMTGGRLGEHDRDETIAIYLWETASGKKRARFTELDCRISCLAFSPDGRQLASGCEDSTILLWDATGRAQQDRKSPIQLTKQELETLWEDLASPDANRASRAIWTLIAAGPQVVSLCQARLRPIPAIQAETLTKLIADLDDNAFVVRQKARQKLQALGEIAEPILHQALEKQLSVQTRRSVEQLLTHLEAQRAAPSGEVLRGIRAIEVLEHISTREARQCLETLSGGAPGVRLTEEAKAAVTRLARRKSQ